jgi:hypothetical protein
MIPGNDMSAACALDRGRGQAIVTRVVRRTRPGARRKVPIPSRRWAAFAVHLSSAVLSLFATTALLLTGLDETPAATAPLVTAEGDVAGAPAEHPHVGVQADVGLPDGAGASAMVMPVSWVRVHVGGLATLSGSGVRAGVTLLAFSRAPVRPTLGVEAGYSFTGSARWIPFVDAVPWLAPALDQVSYGWASAQVGFELGSPHVALVVRGGLSYVDLTFAGPRVDVGGASLSASSMALRGFLPSARVGLMVAFL